MTNTETQPDSSQIENAQSAEQEQAVKDFLSENPGWLATQPELLRDLDLHDQSDGTISLADRQLQQLRRENDLLKQDLTRFLGNAHENEALLHKSFELCLNLLCAYSIDDLFKLLSEQVQELFAISHVRLCHFDDNDSNSFAISKESVKEALGDHFPTKGAITGRLKQAGRDFLFEDSNGVASVALIPFSTEEHGGLLAFGSADEHHFAPENGDLFLNLFARTLTLWLEQQTA